MELIHGDCLIHLKKLEDNSIDFVYLDLPFGQTKCHWDKKIDLYFLWKELKRIARDDRTPFFFSTTTKYGFELFNGSPKDWFRWDLVWKKNRATGFLTAYKVPMRKHEMIYCFAKKSPTYDVSSHKEFVVEGDRTGQTHNINTYNKKGDKCVSSKTHKVPLPTSDITPLLKDHTSPSIYGANIKDVYYNGVKGGNTGTPLPTSDITQEEEQPDTWCEIAKDNKVGHRTAKPVKLMEFLLKYWSKPGDTVLDPTMGSGSMGIACKKMNRKFIGIEMDDDIFNLALERLNKK